MKIPTKTLEKKLFIGGCHTVIGVDEVGMGCLAGPVVVCAVMLTPGFYGKFHRRLARLRDSKLLQAHQREYYADELKKLTVSHAIVSVSPAVIDRMNVYQAARKAMRQAVMRLNFELGIRNNVRRNRNSRFIIPDSKVVVLVDGKTKIDGLPYEQMPVVKGDRKVFAIACASILAKVHRDGLMRRYARRYPGYGLERHKGYGTKLHRQKIKELGLTPLHRRSFRFDKA